MRMTFLAMFAVMVMSIARGTEVPSQKGAPLFEDSPLTSVVVTQCNLVVTVYVTTKDGRLLRFDKSSNIDITKLLQAAYSARRSERVEVSCNGDGLVGYESHDKPI